MPLEKISQVSGNAVYVPGDDIDTDRIIPARFMKCVTFDGLGEYLFYDMKFNEDGSKKNHPLNDTKFANSSIMLTGANFGCGSSREHAPQSLYRAGFRAIIAGNFAEIFFGNSINLGMPCVSVSDETRNLISASIEQDPKCEVVVDILNRVIRVGDSSYPHELREGARDSLLNGSWDPLDELLQANQGIEDIHKNLAYI
ncbi:3-isopropylmalate dehydratase small subunit [Opitutales bacterium]|jgi:3-isopropylmalate/(R)-2-methylmalate dehydratase small subunit|nr:3-isopropylmalate dehydratase small subunit [Opitutales bacterium]